MADKKKKITITRRCYLNLKDADLGTKGHKVLERGDVIDLDPVLANLFIYQNQAVEGEHKIKPGDELFVKRWEEPEVKADAKPNQKP